MQDRGLKRVWLVGESTADAAAFCSNLGMSTADCLRLFHYRVRDSAKRILEESAGCPVVLLGRRAADAFGVDALYIPHDVDGRVVVAVPHPSGRCRAWNDPRAAELTREIVEWLLQEVRDGIEEQVREVEPGRLSGAAVEAPERRQASAPGEVL